MIATLPGFAQRTTARSKGRIDAPLVVDNFAGAGGASLGIEAALGRACDYAINHDRRAIETHAANHPATEHLRCDVWEVDPAELCAGRRVALAWFSPDCKHFSKAKGGRPVSKRIRSLAWVVVKWAKAVRPDVVILENVEEFQTWGPLVGERPCPARKGQTFRRWVGSLRKLGYEVEWRELRACDFGVPTTRKRFFLVARCDGRPILWPSPTHAEPSKAAALGLRPWRTAAECIDCELECPSIFERRRPLAEATQRRIANGLRRFVFGAKQPFIVRSVHYSSLTGEGDTFRGQPVDRPLGTVCAQGNDKALVLPYLVGIDHRGSGDSAAWPAAEPARTVTAEARHGLVSAFLAKHYGGMVGHGLDRPVGTITAKDHHAVVAGSLELLYGTGKGGSVERPMPTVTGQGNHIAEVRAFLVAYFGNERDGQACDAPLRTLTAKQRHGLVTIDGSDFQLVDIGMRMLTPRELLRAQFGRFADEYVLVGRQAQQIAGIGNSVCPELAEAIVRANVRREDVRPPARRHRAARSTQPTNSGKAAGVTFG